MLAPSKPLGAFLCLWRCGSFPEGSTTARAWLIERVPICMKLSPSSVLSQTG